MKFSLLTVSIILFALHADAGNPPSTKWTINNPFSQKVFIENKGQFDGMNNLPGSAIQFVVDDAGTRIFFTPHGLTYSFNLSDDKSSPEAEERKPLAKPTSVYLQMEWEGANPNVNIVAENKVKDYYTYPGIENNKSTIVANGFQKIIYKNLYPDIDVVYTFHEKEGIKYSFILHPGADATIIKMKYGEAENIFKDEIGNIHFSQKA